MPNHRRQIPFFGRITTLCCSMFIFMAACNGNSEQTLQVFAASSLTEAFIDIAEEFEAQNPGVKVELNFGGSQRLRSQIEFGAKVDVFASADQRQIELLEDQGYVHNLPVIFASNQLVVVSSGNGRVQRIEDLAKPGRRLVIAQKNVPVGAYSREVLSYLSGETMFGLKPSFKEEVLRNLVSEEPNVKFVVQKVALGEVDAGIVYQTDVTIAKEAGSFAVIPIPSSANVKAKYPMAVLEEAPEKKLAQSFLQFVLSTKGQLVLTEHGFTGP